MTRGPEINLLICHGALARSHRWRERGVAYGRVLPAPTATTAPLAKYPPQYQEHPVVVPQVMHVTLAVQHGEDLATCTRFLDC